MKKLVALLLAGVVAASCMACDTTEKKEENKVESQNGAQKTEIKDATEVLTKAWNALADDQKFKAMGGDAENMTMDEPGKYNLEKAEEFGLENAYCFPEAELAKIDDAATLVHAMMANNFTAGAYHVKNASDVDGIVNALKDKAANNHWMCGIPETLLIVTVGDNYVVSVFGANDIIESFKGGLTKAYGDVAKVVVEQPVVE